MSDASPAYARQEPAASSASSQVNTESSRTQAPKQMADHVLTVGPGRDEGS
jgi:hypothetical protein